METQAHRRIGTRHNQKATGKFLTQNRIAGIP